VDAPRIRQLEWDSEHFAFPVGEIEGEVGTPERLRQALSVAKAGGVRLLYWLSPDAFVPDPETLSRFGGRRIVGYRRYRSSVTASDREGEADPRCVSGLGAEADSAMVQLAVLAGTFSRFRLDERLPRERFEAMYEIWLKRSLAGEIADEVLVLRDGDDRPQSLVSYRIGEGSAEIGLISTREGAQGKGYGSALLAAVHRDVGRAGGHLVEVSTQTENRGACRLYERSGYWVVRQGSHYHFLMP
jgi:dTDP-4-amino-4,6-dideoxy-D-galactose acyltransferase